MPKAISENIGDEGYCSDCGCMTEIIGYKEGFDYEYGSIRGWHDMSFTGSECCQAEVYVYAYDLDYTLWCNAVRKETDENLYNNEGRWGDLFKWLYKEKYEPEDLLQILYDHKLKGGYKSNEESAV